MTRAELPFRDLVDNTAALPAIGAHMTVRLGILTLALSATALTTGSVALKSQALPDAVAADGKTYTVEFENDIVRVLRVKLAPGTSTPRHAHAAYCAIEISDSS